MSANVELVRVAVDAYNAGNLDESMARWAPDVQVPTDPELPESRPCEWVAAGAASGIKIAQAFTSLFTIRGGLITWVEYYFDRDCALIAAGLTE